MDLEWNLPVIGNFTKDREIHGEYNVWSTAQR